jgi:polar amino acid transport system permease protein
MITFIWDWSLVWEALPGLLKGLEYTVLATLGGSAVALVLGFTWTLLRLANIPAVSPIAVLIVDFLRGTPGLIQLYFIFYVLPSYGLTLSIMTTGVLALGISFSGYTSEVLRAGIEAVAPGQWEACLTMGLPIPHVWVRIILPQAMRTALPMLGSYMIYMFKDSAVLSTIGLSELLGKGMEFGFLYFRFTEPLTTVAALYFAVSYIASLAVRRLEAAAHA